MKINKNDYIDTYTTFTIPLKKNPCNGCMGKHTTYYKQCGDSIIKEYSICNYCYYNYNKQGDKNESN